MHIFRLLLFWRDKAIHHVQAAAGPPEGHPESLVKELSEEDEGAFAAFVITYRLGQHERGERH